jgi:hypothetical protein
MGRNIAASGIGVLMAIGILRAEVHAVVPLGDGIVYISNARLETSLSLTFMKYSVADQTASPWPSIKLAATLGILCGDVPIQVEIPLSITLGWRDDGPFEKETTSIDLPVSGSLKGCTLEILSVGLTSAANFKVNVEWETPPRIDLTEQLKGIYAKNVHDAAVEAERERATTQITDEVERKAEAERARKAEIEAARRKKLAADRKKQEETADFEAYKRKQEDEAVKAEGIRRLTVACGSLYDSTIDKKIRDLTVREEQQIKACQALGLYHH